MTKEQLIESIVGLYQDARVPKYQNQKISRGRSHTISSLVEDLFAIFLIENDSTIDKILIDQPIRLMGGVRKTIYPDITIIRGDQIVAFLDLKMDLGWMRDGVSKLCQKDQDIMNDNAGELCEYRYGESKEFSTRIKISNSAVYDIVVISDQNISKQTLENQREMINKNLHDKVMLHILTKKEHLNTYGIQPSALLDKIIIDDSAFEALFKRIKQ